MMYLAQLGDHCQDRHFFYPTLWPQRIHVRHIKGAHCILNAAFQMESIFLFHESWETLAVTSEILKKECESLKTFFEVIEDFPRFFPTDLNISHLSIYRSLLELTILFKEAFVQTFIILMQWCSSRRFLRRPLFCQTPIPPKINTHPSSFGLKWFNKPTSN